MRKQKILAALLALVMVVTLLPLTALADGVVEENGHIYTETTYYLQRINTTYAGSTTKHPITIYKFDAEIPSASNKSASLCTDTEFDGESYYFLYDQDADMGSNKRPIFVAYSANNAPGYNSRVIGQQEYMANSVLVFEPAGESGGYTIKAPNGGSNAVTPLWLHFDASAITTNTASDTAGTFKIEKAETAGQYYISWVVREEIERPGPVPTIPEQVQPVQEHEKNWQKLNNSDNQPFPSKDGSVLAVGQDSWRIPCLITLDDGRLLAVADANWNEELDSGNIDTVIAISDDNGATWSHQFVNYFDDSVDMINYYATAFMDAAVLQGLDGTIYLIEDLWPGSVASSSLSINNPDSNTNGYQFVDGKERLVLYESPEPENQDDNNWKFYIGDFGENGYAPVYWRFDSKNPYYWVDRWYYLYNYDYTPLYTKQLAASTATSNNQKYASSHYGDLSYTTEKVQANVFFYTDAMYDSEGGNLSTNVKLHARACLYLWLRTSKDGVNWSDPEILNPQVFPKSGCGSFLGVGPGRGEVIKSGTYKGRIIFPLYDNASNERTRVIYKDTGADWHSAVLVTSNYSSEAAPVDVNGVLYVFTRSGSGTGGYYYSTNGGESWSTRQYEPSDKCGDCQRTAILYSKRIDGKPAILLAGTSTTNGSGSTRNYGKIWVGLVDENTHLIEWSTKYSYNIVNPISGNLYGYSCLTEMEDGRIALLWEDYYSAGNPTVIGTMRMDTYTIEQIAPNAVLEPTLEDLPEQLVTVKCDNGFCKGAEATYGAEADGVNIEWDGSDTATATINVNYYVSKFSDGLEVHNLVPESTGDITLNLTYADGEWTVEGTVPAVINVHCDAMPDAPSNEEAAEIIKNVTVTDENGTHANKTYEVTADDISAVTPVNKSDDTYSVEVTLSANNFLDKYNAENSGHTLNSEAELKVTLVYDVEADGWVLKDTAEIEITVACNPSTEQPNPPIVTPPATGGETQIPENEPPLDSNPAQDDGDTDVDEGNTPLAPAPEDKGETDIPNGDTPLDSTPKTGDTSIAIAVLWSIFSMSAVGFVSVMLSMKKSGKHSK